MEIQLRDALLRKREVLRLAALSNSSLYALMGEGRFPRPVRIGTRSVRWLEREVQAFIDACVVNRNDAGGTHEL
ncbi:MAG: AlpA family phage regulatory protein [Pseudomonadota bacterium]